MCMKEERTINNEYCRNTKDQDGNTDTKEMIRKDAHQQVNNIGTTKIWNRPGIANKKQNDGTHTNGEYNRMVKMMVTQEIQQIERQHNNITVCTVMSHQGKDYKC